MPSLTVICAARVHCTACRAVGEQGERFRAGIAAGYFTPATWPACPYGVPMGTAVPPSILRLWRGAGDAVEWGMRVTRADVVARWLRRGRACGCAARRDWLNRWIPFGRAGRGSGVNVISEPDDRGPTAPGGNTTEPRSEASC